VSIAKNARFHILCEQIHVLSQLALEFLRQIFMMLCGKSLHLLQRMQDFTFYVNKSMFFHNLLLNFCDNRLTFRFSWKMFKHWLTSSLLISLEKIWSQR